MDLIFITLDVLKLDKFNEIKEKQLPNKFSIIFTCEVLKNDISSEVNEEHPLNIYSIFATDVVSKLVKSKMISFLQL